MNPRQGGSMGDELTNAALIALIALVQLGRTGQGGQTRIEALGQLIHFLRTVVTGALQVFGLLQVPALHCMQLPQAPAASTGASQADQQGTKQQTYHQGAIVGEPPLGGWRS